MQCCDDECDYFVNYAPTVSVPITFDGMTFNTTKEGDCLAGTRKAYYCGDYWGYAGSSQSCKLDAYWGSSDGEGATIEAVKISEAAQTVTARVTVTIPGTGVWAKPAVLSIVGPRDARDEGLYGMTNHEELIVYPGGIMFSHAVERTVGRRENILFGLLRTEDERVGYKIGTTQSREVKLNRPRVSTALGGAL